MKEFKKFIRRGNVVDMAVGLILPTYFGAIVKSLVNDIIMPPIGLALGGVDFNALKLPSSLLEEKLQRLPFHMAFLSIQ